MAQGERRERLGVPVVAVVSSPIGVMELLEGGVIWHELELAANVRYGDAQEVLRLTEELAAGRPVAVVVDMRRIGFADDDSRMAFSKSDAGGVEVATALLVQGTVAEFLAKRFTQRTPPSRSTRMFQSDRQALEWSFEQLREAREG